ncbi:hypothetical protein CYY_004992 [Polysphondylium violaceum]|uniref:Small-subunit processome Utp12 domain-containing protein n=1 Tax=Polysphondylium violaceum TaxID=133409 RepID=A0A8J4PX95_9MYCE|nr:hypothetical protein CYY_004992 [Polysphondylium violaceum]
MKFGYKFSNLLGTVYKGGNILFTPDGNSVISPVGNRLTVFDLVNHTTITLPIQAKRDIKQIGLSPNGQLLFTADDYGHVLVINLQRQVVLGDYKFSETPKCFAFSPNGAILAIGVKEKVYLFKTPIIQKSNNPLVRLSSFIHKAKVISLDWSSDSLKLLVGCKNGTLLIRKGKSEKPDLFQLHGAEPVACFFGNEQGTIVYGVSKTSLAIWNYKNKQEIEEEGLDFTAKTNGKEVVSQDVSVTTESSSVSEGRWFFEKLNRFDNVGHKNKVKTAVYHLKSKLLVIGFASGQFCLFEMPEYQELYKLNISSHSISTAAINNSGEWLAFGCKDLGQLLVWEWRSETYILKQQGHSYGMNAIAYSPDGQVIATGGDDGKLKLWNTNSGYCYVTFTDHEGPITAVKFSPVASQNVVFSAGLDGTIRAFDLLRYRNFRTFVSPNKTQFSCIAIDPSGEIICAGSTDSFEIYVWSVRTGRLTDILSGHEAPVSDLSFDPINPLLASCSWDKTVKIWNIFEDKEIRESVQHSSDILACAYSADGKKFVSSCLDGTIMIYETAYWNQIGMIDGKSDIIGGRGALDERNAIKNPAGKAFTKIAFTPNGECIIAGGDSKQICIYHVEQQVLVKKYQTSKNLSMDGIKNDHEFKKLTEFGHLDAMEADFDSDAENDERNHEFLPGVTKGDLSKRNTKKKQRTTSIGVSPTGRAWAASTTEGLLIYSLDETLFFDPTDLSIEINPESILATLAEKNFLKSLVMSIKLNEKEIIDKVFEAIPFSHIQLVCQEFPLFYLKNFIQYLSSYFEKNHHIEFQLKWVKYLFIYHGKYVKSNSLAMISSLRSLQKSITQHYNDLSKVCDDNIFSLKYFDSMLSLQINSKPKLVHDNLQKVYNQTNKRMKKWKNLQEFVADDEEKDQEEDQDSDTEEKDIFVPEQVQKPNPKKNKIKINQKIKYII